MIDKLIGVVLGYALCKAIGLFSSGGGGLSSIFHASHHGNVMNPPPPEGGLQVTSTAAPFPTQTPTGLPPFPSGWKPAKTTQDVIQRAQIMLSTLQLGQSKLEKATDGRWIRYVKSKQGTKTMVTAYEPKVAIPSTAVTSGRYRARA